MDIKVYPHRTLNSSKGVIQCKDLTLCGSIEEIITLNHKMCQMLNELKKTAHAL